MKRNLKKKIEVMVNKAVDEKVVEVMGEKDEKEKRKLNLIIVNLPESEAEDNEQKKKDDCKSVTGLVCKVCPELKQEEGLVINPVRLFIFLFLYYLFNINMHGVKGFLFTFLTLWLSVLAIPM